MAGSTFGTRKAVVFSPLVPPSGAKATGEMVRYGGQDRMVYKRLKPIEKRSYVRQAKGPGGELLWQPAPQGVVPRAQRERVVTIPEDAPEAFEEFVLFEDGIGGVHIITDFRPDAKKLAQKKAEAARQARLDALLDALASGDEETLASVMRQAKESKPEEAPEDDAPFRIVRKGGAYFDVVGPDGEPVNEKGLLEDAAQALLDSLTKPHVPEG